MDGFVYILKDKQGKIYIGSTGNLERRLSQHKIGHTQTTRNMKNAEIVFSQRYPSIETTRKVERKLKNLKRKDYIEKIIKDGYIKIS